MAANDHGTDDGAELGEEHSLAARANELDALSDGERDWIVESVPGTDGCENVVGTDGDAVRLVDDADRLAGDVRALAEAHSRSSAFECVDGVDAPTAAHLAAVGVDGPDELVAADSGRLAGELDVDITRVRTWQYQARTRR